MREFSHLGKLLKTKRAEAGLTQIQLALKLRNVHTQFISNWERGLCAPPEHCFDKVIDVLKINRDAMVKAMLADSRVDIEAKVYKRKRAG